MDKISALMDGELDREEAVQLIPALRQRADMRESWLTYHLIGEALRGERCCECAVADTVAQQLVKEPTVLAPRRIPADRGRRWALSSLAAAAAVGMVTWVTIETQPVDDRPVIMPTHLAVPMVGAQPIGSFVDVANSPAAAIQIPARPVEAYLQAHQEFSPTFTIQGLAPYVRTVTSGAAESGR